MKKKFILAGIMAGNVFSAAPSADSVVSMVRNLYNSIETFTADAYVYEYSG